MDTTDTFYLITEGVRRCVAAREAGLDGLPVRIQDRNGVTHGVAWVPFVRMVSPKASVFKYGRRWDFDALIEVLRNGGSERVGMVTVQPLPERFAVLRTPLLAVSLLVEPEDDR